MIDVNNIVLFSSFLVVAIAANQIAKRFQKMKLPFITGVLLFGVFAGPYILGIISKESKYNLQFVNDISLSFIAFAAAAELYIKDLRGRMSSIKWMTFGQLVVTFLFSSVVLFFIADYIPFMESMGVETRIAVSILTATIFVARSPASAIAIINEVRARGPFTQTVMGVTVLKDFLVIILFSICMSLAKFLANDIPLEWLFLIVILSELLLSFVIGFGLGKLIILLLSSSFNSLIKTIVILMLGYSVYLLSGYIQISFNNKFVIEPLLICIVAGFIVTNYSKFRYEFIKLLEDAGPYIYICFFTLAGSSMSLDLLIEVWPIALIFFFIRLISIVLGAFFGGYLAGDSPHYNKVAWMPYITQAGVGLGLATIVSVNFPGWGQEFATPIIAVIIVNQIIGPPFFKWALSFVGETHKRARVPTFDGIRDAIIIGFESQSVALSQQLKNHGWQVKLATTKQDVDLKEYSDVGIEVLTDFSLNSLEKLGARKAEAIVLMLTDQENLKIIEIIYEKIGTKDIIVRLNNHNNYEKFHNFGAKIVDPSTAIVSLMDHFVRSPQATSLLLGLQKGQDSIDLQVLNPNLFGMALRDLKLPQDVIILSIRRNGQMIISHGYTRLRRNDWVTMVGSEKSLNKMILLFDPTN